MTLFKNQLFAIVAIIDNRKCDIRNQRPRKPHMSSYLEILENFNYLAIIAQIIATRIKIFNYECQIRNQRPRKPHISSYLEIFKIYNHWAIIEIIAINCNWNKIF